MKKHFNKNLFKSVKDEEKLINLEMDVGYVKNYLLMKIKSREIMII